MDPPRTKNDQPQSAFEDNLQIILKNTKKRSITKDYRQHLDTKQHQHNCITGQTYVKENNSKENISLLVQIEPV